MFRSLLLVPAVAAAVFSQGDTARNAHATLAGSSRATIRSAGTAAAAPNALQIATLRWYRAMRTGPTMSTGSHPLGLAFNGTDILDVDQGSGQFSAIEPGTGKAIFTEPMSNFGPTVCGEPSGIIAVGTNIWVSCNTSGNVFSIAENGCSLTVRCTSSRHVSVGAGPYGMAYDGTSVWVANSGGDTVTRVSPGNASVTGEVTVGKNPTAVAFDGVHIWVTNRDSNTVSEIDTANLHVVRKVKVGKEPYGIAFDGQHMWVSNTGTNTVSEISAATAKVVKTVTVGKAPSAMVFDGRNIWSANYTSNTVSEIDATTGKVIATVPTGNGPDGLAFDGSKIWVSNYNDDSLQEL